MMEDPLVVLAALISLQAAPALADNYDVNLTHRGRKVYNIDGRDNIIQTRCCYIYAYSDEAIFKLSGYSGEVIFFDSRDTAASKWR